MSYETIELKKESGITYLTMNNPATLNALSKKTINELHGALDEIEKDSETKVVVITGAGKAFIAGADIQNMSTMNPLEAAQFSYDTQAVYRKMLQSSKVFIAAINGFALGGGLELALACDMRIAAVNAKLGLPEVNLGIIPGGGGTQRLPRVVGTAKAMELILTGDIIKADEALNIGLVNRLVAKEDLLNETTAIAQKIIKNAPIAVGYAKACINMSVETTLNSGLEYEKHAFGLCFSTEDQKEGMAAFLEKREVVFQNK